MLVKSDSGVKFGFGSSPFFEFFSESLLARIAHTCSKSGWGKHILEGMNFTLSADKETIERTRECALKHGTSLNRLSDIFSEDLNAGQFYGEFAVVNFFAA